MDLSLELYFAAERFGIPVIATIHDFYYACPTIILLDNENQFCQKEDAKLSFEERQKRCRECLRQKKDIASQVDYLRIWRRENKKALSICRKLIFPSESARDILLEYFPSLKEKCMVIEHGEDKLERDIIHVPSPEKHQKSEHLHVKLDRVPGADQGLNDIKGWAYLEGVPNEETKIYVEFTDSKGKKDCFLANKVPRPDIVDAFGATEALMCGLDLRISTRKLADGPVKIRVYVKHDGVFYTDNQSTKGEYHHRFGKRGRLNVAFLGGMVPQKGSLMARELIFWKFHRRTVSSAPLTKKRNFRSFLKIMRLILSAFCRSGRRHSVIPSQKHGLMGFRSLQPTSEQSGSVSERQAAVGWCSRMPARMR